MNNINFDAEFSKITLSFECKKTLLLHCCCAPCFCGVIDRVKDFFDVTCYFYNPNITDKEEYTKRLNAMKIVCNHFGTKLVYENFEDITFLDLTQKYAKEREGGKRCNVCFASRLFKSSIYAKENNFDYFATTLTVSPHKNATLINNIGEQIAQKHSTKYLVSDFKKQDGFKKSVTKSKELDIYRQDYCGCKFSFQQRFFEDK